jgi:hypothetical protein
MNANTKKQCGKKNNGIMICSGCQKSFCGKHVNEHRQELGAELDDIRQEHDLLHHKIEKLSIDDQLFQEIDQWEKESIEKIQLAATTARKNLQDILDQLKQRFSKTCRDIAVNIYSSCEADDYSEDDLDRWKEQLETLKLTIKSSTSVEIIQDQKSVIHLITVKSSDSNKEQFPLTRSSSNPKIKEKFLDVVGPVSLESGGYIAEHVGPAWSYAYIRGHLLYSQGRRTITFKVEECNEPYLIFFGCISSQIDLEDDIFSSSAAVGWFGSNQVYDHGHYRSSLDKYDYHTYFIQTNDILHLTIDCERKKIMLLNRRLNTQCTLPVNINKIPFPWQLLIVMLQNGDCVRILP